MPELSKADRRKKFGHCPGPIAATRVLSMPMPHFARENGQSLIIINDKTGMFTAANIYNGNFGKNYDPETMVHPLPAPGADKWKEWDKKGYKPQPVGNYDVLAAIESDGSESGTETSETETSDVGSDQSDDQSDESDESESDADDDQN